MRSHPACPSYAHISDMPDSNRGRRVHAWSRVAEPGPQQARTIRAAVGLGGRPRLGLGGVVEA